MARTLKTRLELDTVMAKRNADQVTGKLRGVGQQGAKAGKEAGGGMDLAAKATAGFQRQILTLGASYLTLAALQRLLTSIVEAYNKAYRAREQWARGAIGIYGAVAPAAAQFGVSEKAMADLVVGIGREAGAGPGDIGAISAMITSAASAGLIGAVRPGAEGRGLAIAPEDRAKLVMLSQFVQYAGAPGMAPELAKLVRKGISGAKTPEATQQVLGQTMAAFRASQMADWQEFITGAVAGTSTLLEQGVSYETAISRYAGLAKMERSGVRAGETLRMLGERFFTGDDPKIVRLIDRRLGSGAYWRLKKEDPDQLFGVILQELTTPTGRERARLYKRLDIPIEQGGRLARLAGAAPEIADIETRMRAVTPELAGAELGRWRAGPRARAQAAGIAGQAERELAEAAEMPERAAMAALAKAGITELEAEHPTGWMVRRAAVLGSETAKAEMGLQYYIEQRLRERFGQAGEAGSWEPVLRGKEWRFRRVAVAGGPLGTQWEEKSLAEYLKAYPEAASVLMPGPQEQSPSAGPAPTTPPGPAQPPPAGAAAAPQPSAGVVINNPAVVYARTPDEMATNTATRVDQE